MTGKTITSFEALAAQLATVRETGLSYESEESDRHVRCVGALLQNAREKIQRIVAERDVDFYQTQHWVWRLEDYPNLT